MWYVILLGGTSLGELDPVLRLINGLLGGALILACLIIVRRDPDHLDHWVLAAVLLFAVSGIFSAFPRQSFDSVLAALAYGAGFLVSRRITAIPEARQLFVWMLQALSALLTLIVAMAWVPLFVEWWIAAGRTVVPPLDFDLHAGPWGHRHDLTLLVVMLYPSWWIGIRGRIHRLATLPVGAAVAAIVIIDGSRTIWIAMVIAGLLLLARPIYHAARRRPRFALLVVGGLASLTAVLLLSDLGRPLVERVTTINTLQARSAMWGSLVDAWLTRPLTGFGPGTFPWVLQQTAYFDANSWAPRHPDSIPFQLIAETGIIGVAAIACLLIGVVPLLLRMPVLGAWPLLTFAIAGIGASPTDFPFLICTAIAWAAFGMPRAISDDRSHRQGRARRTAILAVGVVVAGLYLSTSIAAHAYGIAARAATQGRLASAVGALDISVALDPGLALYRRQRGTANLLSGQTSAAIRDLKDATALNPSDDLASRSLATALRNAGRTQEAYSELDRALAAQRSDPTNLLIAAAWHAEDGDRSQARRLLGEIVQTWPAIVGANGWNEMVDDTFQPAELVDAALARWTEGIAGPDPFDVEALWLVAMTRRMDLLDSAVQVSQLSPTLAESYVASLSCMSTADALVRSSPSEDRRASQYWAVAVRQSVLAGHPDANAVRAYQIMTGGSLSRDAEATLSAIEENAGFSADAWGYQRRTIDWPPYEPELPSPSAAWIRWIANPRVAAAESGLAALAGCR